MCWSSGLNFPENRFFWTWESLMECWQLCLWEVLEERSRCTEHLAKGDGAVSAPLFADKKMGLGALPSAPWTQQLWGQSPVSLCHGGLCSPCCSLSLCMSNAMHFPVETTPLGTKPSNHGHSVPRPELGLQSTVCSGLEGLMAVRVATLTGHQRGVTFSDHFRGFLCPSWGCLCAQQLWNTGPLSRGGLNSCLVLSCLFTPCISRTSVLLYGRQDIGCLWLISFPVVLQPPRALFRRCLSASIVCCCCLFFFSHRPLKLEQCLHTGTSDNPANNGFTSLVRSCAASRAYWIALFPLFP